MSDKKLGLGVRLNKHGRHSQLVSRRDETKITPKPGGGFFVSWKGGEAYVSSIEGCRDNAVRWWLGLPKLEVPPPKASASASSSHGGSVGGMASSAVEPKAVFAAAKAAALAKSMQMFMHHMAAKGEGKGMGSKGYGPYGSW